jgi:hypothetical protein
MVEKTLHRSHEVPAMELQKSTRSNRRLAPRRSPKKSSKITCRKGHLGLGPNLAVELLDLSEGGVRLVVKAVFNKGDEVEVGLMAPGGMREALRKGHVAWAVPTAQGQCCIGVCFEKYLEYALLSDLGRLPTC